MFSAGGSSLEDKRLDDALIEEKAQDLPREQVLAFEKEAIGFYLTAHPLDGFHEVMEESRSVGCGLLKDAKDSVVKVAGMVTSLRTINDRNGNEMAFLTIQDTTGSCEGVVFGRYWVNPTPREGDVDLKAIIRPEAKVILRGKVQRNRGDTPSLEVIWGETITKAMADEARQRRRAEARGREAAKDAAASVDAPAKAGPGKTKRLVVTFVVEDTLPGHLDALKDFLASRPSGPDHVYWQFVRRQDGERVGPCQVGGPNSGFGVHATDELVEAMAQAVPAAKPEIEVVAS